MKKLNILFAAILISAGLSAQVLPYSINNGGNLNSCIGQFAASLNSGIFAIIADESSDIELLNEQADISIYPNSVKDVIYIKTDANVHYDLYDINAKQILSGNDKQINVSHLKNGIYILNINNKNFKIIKQQ